MKMPALSQRGIGRTRLSVVALCLIVCAVGIATLSSQFREKLELLSTAKTDSIQWSMSQLEVEALKLRLAVQEAMADPSYDLQSVRTRFDVLYSRVELLNVSPLFADIARTSRWYNRDVAALKGQLDRLVPLIDGSDEALRSGLPAFADEAAALQTNVREISLRSIRHFASVREAERIGISDILVRIATLTALLVLLLLGLTLLFWRLNRESLEQALTLQNTTARLQSIITTAIDAVIVGDEKGRILNFNPAAEAVFGYSADEALGRNVMELIAPDHTRERHKAAFERYLVSGESDFIGKGRVQFDARDKTGRVFPTELSINQVCGENGRIFVSFLRDISHRVASEAELRTARDQAIAGEKAKAELLAVMSHEMRTPLNGLLGTIELLEDTELSEAQQTYARIMRNSGKLLLHQVNSVLDISRADSGMMEAASEPFDLNQMLEELVDGQRKVAEDRGNTLELITGGAATGFVVGDAVKLRQVTLNLLGNALKFTSNGRVEVSAAVTDDEQVRISVSDTGVGIPPEQLTRIFDEFVTLDTNYDRTAEGTGLGLAIAQRLAEVMGGRIQVESTPGEGSTFHLTLPILPPEGMRSTPPWNTPAGCDQTEDLPAVGPLRILMVEDNPINRVVAREMLEKDGHRVSEAHNGQDGAAAALSDAYDLILMDISMPQMDGVTCTEAIRSNPGPNLDTPIVALTAHALPDEVARFREAGMNATLTKPITRKAMRQVLGEMLRPGAEQIEDGDDDTDDMLDFEALASLTETMAPGHLERLLGEFLAETEAELDELTRHLADMKSGDGERLRSFADRLHRVSGSAAVFGGVVLRREMIAIEHALRDGQLREARRLWPALSHIWQKTRTALDLAFRDDAA